MTTENKKILIVEDNVAEAIYAQAEVAKAGFRDFTVSTNLESALYELGNKNYDFVLSDLFFPSGNNDNTRYIEKFLPVYESYKDRRFEKINESGPISYAVKACCEALKITPEEYLKLLPTMTDIPMVITAVRDVVKGVKNSERYEQFLTMEDKIRTGTNMPLGIIVCEKTREKNIPTRIITSTYHHDDAFEPVKNLIQVPYYDTLIEGRKNWKSGIKSLLK